MLCVSLAVVALQATAAHAQLELTVEANPDPAAPGETVQVAVTVANSGGVNLDDVSVQLPVPSGVSGFFTSLTTGGGECPGICGDGDTVTWTFGTLEPGEGTTVTAPFEVVTSSPPASLVISAFGFQGLVEEANDQVTVPVVADPTLDLALAERNDPVPSLGPLAYDLSYGNRDDATALGVGLTLTLPVGATFVSASDGGTESLGVVSWSLGDLPPGAGGQVHVTASAPSAVDGSLLTATAEIANADSARAMAVTRVDSSPTLRVGVEANPDPAYPGEHQEALVTVTNPSLTVVEGVFLKIRQPDGVRLFLSGDVSGNGGCSSGQCNPGDLAEWSIGALAPGEGATISLPVTSVDPIDDGTVLFFDPLVEQEFPDTTRQLHASTRAAIVIETSPALDVAFGEDRDPVLPGEQLTYTLDFANRGPIDTTGVVPSLTLPQNASFVSASDGGVHAGGVVTWPARDVDVERGGRVHAVAVVDVAAAGGDFVEAHAKVVDGLQNEMRGRALTRVADEPVLAITVELNPGPIAPDENGNALITVTNQSGEVQEDLFALMRLPWEIQSFFEDPVSGDFSCGLCQQGELGRWTIPILEADEGVSFALPLAPFGSLVSEVTTLETAAGQVLIDDTDRPLATHRASVRVQTDRDLDLALFEDADPVAPAGTLQYTLVYGNRGLVSATSSELTLWTPAGTSFVSATGGGTESAGAVTWDLGDLPAGSGGSVQATVAVPAGASNGDLLAASAWLRDSGSGRGEARAEARTRVQAAADLDVSIVSAPDPAALDDDLDIAFTVTNTSGGPLDDVLLIVRIPDEFDEIGPTQITGGGDCAGLCRPPEFVQWPLGTLQAAESRLVRILPSIFGNDFVEGPPEGTVVRLEALVGAAGVPDVGRRHAFLIAAPPGFCGDGQIDPGEQCDDGNNVSGDGCDAMCVNEGDPVCGDNILQAGEQCDDGNNVPGDGCDAQCQLEPGGPLCGNGEIDPGEECDDGNNTPGDGCDEACLDEVVPACGDGILQAGEECDDGNNTPGDGCNGICEEEIELLVGDTKLGIKLNFKKTGKDSVKLKIKNLQLAETFTGDGQTVTVDVGGAAFDAPLGPKGKYKSPDKRDSLKMKQSKKDGSWKLSAKRKKGDFAAAFAGEGLLDEDNGKPGKAVSVDVDLDAGGTIYRRTESLSYRSKAGKKGSAK